MVVFLVDDLGYMGIGANNPGCLYDTPNVDRLAKPGMRFSDGYAANPVYAAMVEAMDEAVGVVLDQVGASSKAYSVRASKPLNLAQ